MNIILYDQNRSNYYPLSLTRPISHFRIGILTIEEKWKRYCKSVSVKTDDYLSQKFAINQTQDNIWINSQILPSQELIVELKNLREGESLTKDNEVFAFRNRLFDFERLNAIESNVKLNIINNLTDIFLNNFSEIENDFKVFANNKSNTLNNTNICLGDQIFIDNGADIRCSILNSENGPIYIGKNVEIMEGSIIHGPCAILDNAVLKMGSKIYGGTTIGPYCKIGGEVSNSILFGYSSKAHDGYLGNSIIGEWCNLGANTNVSNLKNNYANIKLWNYNYEKFIDTGLQFCGLIMGDHSKSGINTMFNTGTIIGVGVNIFGTGFPRNFIPSFSWGGTHGFQNYQVDKFFDVASKVCFRRNIKFSKIDQEILLFVYNMTKRYRNEV